MSHSLTTAIWHMPSTAAAVRNFFQHAPNRDSYREGVAFLRKLIQYGGAKEAEQIAIEQTARTPRRPALIDELSKP